VSITIWKERWEGGEKLKSRSTVVQGESYKHTSCLTGNKTHLTYNEWIQFVKLGYLPTSDELMPSK